MSTIVYRTRRAVRSWMFVYLAFAAAMYSAAAETDKEDRLRLSPVEISVAAPALRIDSLTRRSDI